MFRRHRRRTRDPVPVAEAAATSMPSRVVAIDDSTFMDQTAGRVTIVDFWAPWCGPCQAFAPIFEAAASDHEGRAVFAKCNVDTNPKTTALLQIQSIPTLIAFGSDGSELERAVGLVPRRQLDALVQRVAPTATV